MLHTCELSIKSRFYFTDIEIIYLVADEHKELSIRKIVIIQVEVMVKISC